MVRGLSNFKFYINLFSGNGIHDPGPNGRPAGKFAT